jgi:phage terminase large subunit
MNQDIYVNDVYVPYLEEERRTQIYYGGSSSGKSFFLAQRTVMDNLKGVNYLIVRNVGATLKNSTFNEIKKAIYAMGVAHLYRINESTMSVTCTLNGKQILFSGLDNVEKLKSITPSNGVLERIWIEEATEIKRDAYMQLKKRLRGHTKFSKSITMSFNPILKEHWIYKEFFNNWDDSKRAYKDNDLSILKTTYKDNKFLEPDDIYELENEKDPYFRDVYTYGNWGILGNLVFTNWRVEDLSDRKQKFNNIYNGLDFGYTNPNAFVRVHVDERNKKIYVIDEMYKRGQTYEQLSNEIAERIGSEYITCDNEDGRAIFTLGSYGLRAIPAKKGPDSVLFGINWLKGYEIIIDISCQNFKNEIQAYHWDEDKNGNVLERPVKKNDHLLDALRYATESIQVTNKATVGGVRW